MFIISMTYIVLLWPTTYDTLTASLVADIESSSVEMLVPADNSGKNQAV